MTRISLALLFAFSALACTRAPLGEPAAVTAAEPALPPVGKLPLGVTPKSYDLSLTIDPKEPRFSGHVSIAVHLDQPRGDIWIHAQRLDIAHATFEHAGVQHALKVTPYADAGVLRLQGPVHFNAGDGQLQLTFSGPFDDQLDGLYRVKEGDHWYAFTQFEAISARKAFPCFDEPRFKTPFRTTVTVPEGDVALTNETAVGEKNQDGYRTVVFKETKALPTYLIAFATGPLEVVEGGLIPPNDVRPEPVPLRAITVKGKGAQTAYALRHTPALLREAEEYLGVAYPYGKMDIVAVPDFAAGAMENVGLVTFREWLLLLDENSSVRQKRAFAYVMVHELAHMWFGNLVTMPWWDDIWLNESFASWLEYQIIERWRPEYKADLALADDSYWVMGPDALVSARQIRQPINTNHDIHNAFDGITYSKGAAVLSMFQQYMGPEKFRQGIAHYLNHNAHGSADYQEFLQRISEGSGVEVSEAMKSFLFQPGLPLVKAELKCDGSPSLALSQSRYLPLGSKGDANRQWQVPVCVRYPTDEGARQQCALLTEPSAVVPLETETCPAWVHPNAHGAGYYRWELPPSGLAALMAAGGALTPREHIALADAVVSGVDRGVVSAEQALAAAETFARHPERRVATAPMDMLQFLRDYVADESTRGAAERVSRRMYQRLHARLDQAAKGRVDDEGRLFHRSVTTFMAEVGQHARVKRNLIKAGREYAGLDTKDLAIRKEAIDPNLAALALRAAAESANRADVDRLLKHFINQGDPDLRRHLLSALSHVKGEFAAEVRARLLTDDVRVNEVSRVLRNMMRQPDKREETWAWVQTNYDQLLERLPSQWSGDLPWLAKSFCSAKDKQRVEAFFGPRIEQLDGGPRNLEGVLEAIDLCAAKAKALRPGAAQLFAR